MANVQLCRIFVGLFVLFVHTRASSQTVNQELTDIFNQLWRLDVNRFQAETDYKLSPQGKAGYVSSSSSPATDHASSPLFSYVNERKLASTLTYARFMKILDNYERATGEAERVTEEEKSENNAFLDAVLHTAVMKHAHQYLVRKGKSNSATGEFKKQLYTIWFHLYHRNRNGGEDSSGFEHVFVGETKFGTEIMGLHNWVQFYLQEKQRLLDYKGYKSRNMPSKTDHVLNVQFSWHGLVKPVGSTFVGVSPEFEMAIFTILFLSSTEKTSVAVVQLDKYELEMVVHRHGRSIGTCYPKLLSIGSKRV